MMVSDAKWLGEVLPKFSIEELSPVLNIGSSTKKFREEEQPHIHEYVFAPLEAKGIKVIHCDLKQGEGVDVSADIFDDSAIEKLKSYNAKSIICTHMFEHVTNKEDLAKRLLSLIPDKGLFFITVPNSYHQHDDPIDTMYRPTPEELSTLFKGQNILQKDILVDGNYWGKIKQRPFTLFFRHFTRFFIPFLSVKKWKRSMRKLYWLFNNYKVSAIVGRKVV
jgi:hypothetical protein